MQSLNTNQKGQSSNHYFKSIDSAEQQYVLGWIYSKGYLFNFKNIKHSGLSIKVPERDKYILKYIQELLSSKRPIVIEVMNGRNYAKLTIGNKDIYDDLMSCGLVPTTNAELEYPVNTITNHAAFILGYFEGNGSISFNNKTKIPTIEIVGTESMISTIRDILVKKLSLIEVPLIQTENSHRIKYPGFYVVNKIRKWLYHWNPGVCLIRKKITFDELLSITNYGYSIFRCPHCGKQQDLNKLNIKQHVKIDESRDYCSIKCSLSFIDNIM